MYISNYLFKKIDFLKSLVHFKVLRQDNKCICIRHAYYKNKITEVYKLFLTIKTVLLLQ